MSYSSKRLAGGGWLPIKSTPFFFLLFVTHIGKRRRARPKPAVEKDTEKEATAPTAIDEAKERDGNKRFTTHGAVDPVDRTKMTE